MQLIKLVFVFVCILFFRNVTNAQAKFFGTSKPIAVAELQGCVSIDNISPTAYIKKYVVESIAEWQKKGEFEKTADYKLRVTEQSRITKIQDFTNEAVIKFKNEYAKTIDWSEFKLSEYDADNETFLIKSSQYGDFALTVPISEAQSLKQNWSSANFLSTDFFIIGNNLKLAKVKIVNTSIGKEYLYDSKNSTTYSANNITYNFAPINVEVPTDKIIVNNTKLENKNSSFGKDPIDINIPIDKKSSSNTFALVVGNENYRNEINVPFASNDAAVFAEYCKKTLGIPSNNLKLLIDGTYGQMLSELRWIEDVIKAYNGEAQVYVYYAGHGMPGESDKNAYLLPTDGNSSITRTAIKLDELYSGLSASPSKSVTVFLDACFSGAAREGSLTKGRGVKIVPRENELTGNLVVFSATSADETALPYNDKGHGLFTYYLLKKLQDSQGNVTLYDLSSYVIDNVKRESIVVNNKAQNPKVNSSSSLQSTWQNLKLK
jgi:hypothetical protein